MQSPEPATPNIAILPREMPEALERVGDGIRVLSLDCFDTLLWRDCHAPADLFTALPGLSVAQRVKGEQNARRAEATLRKRTEVSIEAIYEQAMPNAEGVDRANAVEAELAAEARACVL